MFECVLSIYFLFEFVLFLGSISVRKKSHLLWGWGHLFQCIGICLHHLSLLEVFSISLKVSCLSVSESVSFTKCTEFLFVRFIRVCFVRLVLVSGKLLLNIFWNPILGCGVNMRYWIRVFF